MSDLKDEIEVLKRRIAELEAQQAPQAGPAASLGTPARVKTDGGAVVGNSVRMANGHFIGRDYNVQLTQIVQPGESQADAEQVVAAYLRHLAMELSALRLGEIDGLDHGQREALQLRDVYVPLNTTLRINQVYDLHEWLALSVQSSDKTLIDRQGRAVPDQEYRAVPVLEALAEHKALTLLGKPGSGKTSFCARMLLAMVEAFGDDKSELVQLGEGWTVGALFPIRVVLREFADQLPAGDAPACAGDLWSFIGRRLRDNGMVMQPDQHSLLQRLAVRHGALVVFDGLDECGGETRRARVQTAVDGFMQSCGEDSRFVLTARPYAFPGGQDPARGVYLLADFDEVQIEGFIRRWYEVLPQRRWCLPIDAERKCTDLLTACARPALRALTPNPLLLTLMAVLHYEQGHVPGNRAELYDESVKLLLQRWNRKSGGERALCEAIGLPDLDLLEVRKVLQQLAFDVHASSTGETEDEDEGDLDIGKSTLLQALRPLLQQSLDKAEAMVDYIEHRTGLLLGLGPRDGERRFSFPHRTFREYLAACYLTESDDFDGECLRLARANPDHWAQVLPLAGRIAGLPRAANAADELIGSERIEDHRAAGKPISAAQWKCAEMAGLMLREQNANTLQSNTGKPAAVSRRVRHWLAAALPVHPDDGGLSAVERTKIGDLLAELGDPRFDPERLHLPADPDLGFVRIPADPDFRIGTRRADGKRVAEATGQDVDEDEINDTPTPTPEFWVARYPVTVAQFRAFVEDSGVSLGDARALRDADTRPVCCVSWDEANAYAAWLQRQLREASVFHAHPVAALVRVHGWQVMLPSERVWEKAARGGREGAVFPWGDMPDSDRANIDIGNTSAVGAFPPNDDGLYDMVGNAWEWTRTAHGAAYSAPEPEASSESDYIVVRGGGWVAPRSTDRDGAYHGIRGNLLGFRVVLCCSPVR